MFVRYRRIVLYSLNYRPFVHRKSGINSKILMRRAILCHISSTGGEGNASLKESELSGKVIGTQFCRCVAPEKSNGSGPDRSDDSREKDIINSPAIFILSPKVGECTKGNLRTRKTHWQHIIGVNKALAQWWQAAVFWGVPHKRD